MSSCQHTSGRSAPVVWISCHDTSSSIWPSRSLHDALVLCAGRMVPSKICWTFLKTYTWSLGTFLESNRVHPNCLINPSAPTLQMLCSSRIEVPMTEPILEWLIISECNWWEAFINIGDCLIHAIKPPNGTDVYSIFWHYVAYSGARLSLSWVQAADEPKKCGES
jgi:hypothetical protein